MRWARSSYQSFIVARSSGHMTFLLDIAPAAAVERCGDGCLLRLCRHARVVEGPGRVGTGALAFSLGASMSAIAEVSLRLTPRGSRALPVFRPVHGRGEGGRRIDEGHVRESLGKVAEQAARGRIVLFRQ